MMISLTILNMQILSRLNEMPVIESVTLDHVVPEVFVGNGDGPLCERSDVWNTDLTLHRGRLYLISADSGTGKSSLCSYIYGNRTDYAGRIMFDSDDVRTFSPRKWSRLRQNAISILPQELRLFTELTAMENILIKNRLTGYCSVSRIVEMLDMLGVAGLADRRAAMMSVGQQQRVAVVRALCQPFDFLLLDEPVSHLDRRNNMIVSDLLADEASRRGAAIVATSVGNDIMIENTICLKL